MCIYLNTYISGHRKWIPYCQPAREGLGRGQRVAEVHSQGKGQRCSGRGLGRRWAPLVHLTQADGVELEIEAEQTEKGSSLGSRAEAGNVCVRGGGDFVGVGLALRVMLREGLGLNQTQGSSYRPFPSDFAH